MAEAQLVKYPLGRDLFATVKMWQGFPKIHIRKFISYTSLKDPYTVVSCPTRHGIAMEIAQFRRLMLVSTKIVEAVQTLDEEDGKATEITGDYYNNMCTTTNITNEAIIQNTPEQKEDLPKKSQGKRTSTKMDAKSQDIQTTMETACVQENESQQSKEDDVFKTPVSKPRRRMKKTVV